MTHQTDFEMDAIRERQDARELKAKNDDASCGDALDRQAYADRWAERDALLERRWKAETKENESAAEIRNLIDNALAEVRITQKQHMGGTVDYTESGGVLLEYLPVIILALRAVCLDEREIVDLQERIQSQRDTIKDMNHARAAAHYAAQTVGHAMSVIQNSILTDEQLKSLAGTLGRKIISGGDK